MLITDLRFGDGGVRARLRATLRSHVVLSVAVVLPLMTILLGRIGLGPSGGIVTRVAGRYSGTPLGVDVVSFMDKIAHFMSREVLGTGFLPAAIAAPWLVTHLVRAWPPQPLADPRGGPACRVRLARPCANRAHGLSGPRPRRARLRRSRYPGHGRPTPPWRGCRRAALLTAADPPR